MDGLVGGQFTATETIQNFGVGWGGVALDIFKTTGDAIEARFDSGIADAEGLLHFFDGAVGADKRSNEDLIFLAEARQLRHLKRAFYGYVLFREAYTFDEEMLALGELREFLPIQSFAASFIKIINI